MKEIAEMTMVFPGSMTFMGSPSYPWSPDLIENLPEWERKGYLRILENTRKEMADMGSKGAKGR